VHDTSPEIEQRIIEMMKTRTPSERAAMVSGMFHAGKTLVIAGIRAQRNDIKDNELKVELFRRMYGADFSEEEIARICRYFSEVSA
jgi:hypothetical protein